MVARLTKRTVSVAAAALLLCGSAGCGDREVAVKDRPVPVLREEPGYGRAAVAGDFVTINYEIALEDGRIIQKERDYRFELGAGVVITAIDEAVSGMKKRGVRVVECPPHKHWGRPGYGEGHNAIPPNALLLITVELRDID